MLQGFHDSGFHAEKPLLVLPSCLLLLLLAPLVSAVPMPRSLRLGSHQQHPPTLKLSSSQETTAMNTGRPTTRMDVEVNDYQPLGPNNRHDPPILAISLFKGSTPSRHAWRFQTSRCLLIFHHAPSSTKQLIPQPQFKSM
ncbi:uncharacterized protein [Zea mays]|uniref:uncharacterized protein n=1 Tax=Zea mays TaxID=4577 RepID=UPI0004DEB123|nr:uncharacterized protein LOC103653028 [Zea mays]|eukprot:XP_008678229.1 uncharacterized protein LOC103653028 [Zea mays]